MIRLAALLAVTLGAALAAATPAAAVQFRSPSGNIGCFLTSSGVRCDIADRTWRAPRQPRSCNLDYGNGVSVARRGKAEYVCAGDTVLGAGRRLGYGDTIRSGRFRCRSRRSGMRCTNRRSSHGFFISQARVRLF